MKPPPLRLRLFLLVVAALTPALVLALLAIRADAVGLQPGLAVVLALAVFVAALALFWYLIDRWCRDREAHEAATTQALAQALQADVDQRNHLLRELHHRVKNNLQMISSLLSLQADRIRSPRIRRVFAGAQNRVLTMSILHRHLYERTDWAQVDFQAYLNDLVRHLSVGNSVDVRFSVSAPVMAVGPDVAIPIGLIVTEAVSNALTHAFGGIADPRITIAATDAQGRFELSIDDNGISLQPAPESSADRGGLGFTLLRGLSAQLDGEATIVRRPEGGTRVLVQFPSPTAQAAAPSDPT
ncbi:MAG TPA: sensor histidine kinase [Vineibacter sp.]|nr:sensor histidine kinase [Vineibacter sp.]